MGNQNEGKGNNLILPTLSGALLKKATPEPWL